MRPLTDIFEIALNNVIKYCFDRNPYSMYFFKEEDLRCALVNEIFCMNKKLERQGFPLYLKSESTNKKPNVYVYSPSVLVQVKYGKNVTIKNKIEEKRYYCDIVLFDKNNLRFKIRKKEYKANKPRKKVYEYEYDYWGNVFIELKFSWNKRRGTILKEIIQDSKKLIQKDIKYAYIVYLDYSGNIKDYSDIKNRSNKVKIIYIDALNKKVFCNNKKLQTRCNKFNTIPILKNMK